MLNLLKFEYKRLFKSIFFRIIAGYCIIWPVIVTIFYRILFNLMFDDESYTFKDFLGEGELRFFTWIILVAFVNELPKFIALFACLHIGRDYSDGVIRNKIIAGHSRASIYFSYMITQMSATVIFTALYVIFGMLGLLITGIGVDLNGGEMFTRLGTALMVLLAMNVIFIALSSISRKRALPIILSIVIVMVMSTAVSIVGTFNTPGSAVDEYIEKRHEVYEEMIDDDILTEDIVEDLEDDFDRDSYLSLPWKICHPVYLITNLGYNGDYSVDLMQLLVGNPDYTDEIDFSQTIVTGGYDLSGLSPRDFKRSDAMHVTYGELNLTYTIRSLIWIAVIGGWGFVVFQRKNQF